MGRQSNLQIDIKTEEDLWEFLKKNTDTNPVIWFEVVVAAQNLAHKLCAENGYTWPLAAQIALWVHVKDSARTQGNDDRALLQLSKDGFLIISESDEKETFSLVETRKYFDFISKTISSRKMLSRAYELTMSNNLSEHKSGFDQI